MRILADENVSGAIVRRLRQQGYDVRWISEGDSGLSDDLVWLIVVRDQRFLITSDKLFASSAMLHSEAKSLSLMLLRISSMSPEHGAERVSIVIGSQELWNGKFCVVSAEGVRIRQL